MAEQSKPKTTTRKPTTDKHAGGAPLKYKTNKQLSDAVEEYFDWCDNRVRNVYIKEVGDNVPIADPAPYTMSGLAYALEVDRRTLLNYSKREQFFPTVKRARERVEADLESRLYEKGNATAGIIFSMKNNFDWKDSQQVDHTTNGKDLPAPILGGLANQTETGDAED